jgi:KAP family P-loop domain
LIDDIDRLFPAEAFEMVRIVKAVGDLPNVGYVLAWDAAYVCAALEKLNVPFAETYLDKIVQVRLPIPPLSFPMRVELMNKGLRRLPDDSHKSYFPNGDERNGMMFHYGLNDLMEQPRDVIRLFDTVASIEPGLRGEIHLADIIGLACLMTKAPKVYELLHRTPQAFVGRRPGAKSTLQKAEEVIAEHSKSMNAAIDSSPQPIGLRKLVYWLFPKVATGEDAFTFDRTVFTERHLAHPERLLLALQLSARRNDLSLVRVQQYLLRPEARPDVEKSLDPANCVDFLIHLGEMAVSLETEASLEVTTTCIAITRMVDGEAFVLRARDRKDPWFLRPGTAAIDAIAKIARNLDQKESAVLAGELIADPAGLSVATEIAARSFLANKDSENLPIRAKSVQKHMLLETLAKNIEAFAKTGSIFNTTNPEYILWTAAALIPDRCKAIFRNIEKHDPSLDKFVEVFLRYSFDSHQGQTYGVPHEIERLERFVSLADLKRRGEQRLEDSRMQYPVRAAWRAIVEGGRFYGRSGDNYEG